jgi:hypothetical protein
MVQRVHHSLVEERFENADESRTDHAANRGSDESIPDAASGSWKHKKHKEETEHDKSHPHHRHEWHIMAEKRIKTLEHSSTHNSNYWDKPGSQRRGRGKLKKLS